MKPSNRRFNQKLNYNLHCFLVLVLALLLSACKEETKTEIAPALSPKLIDVRATAETRALYENLFALQGKHVLFGHQDDLAYGVNWVAEDGRSDVKDTAGAYPAITGWEIGGLAIGEEVNLDKVNFKKMQQWIKDVYTRGGINTISWHMYNPVTGENSWSGGDTVSRMIPGGDHHEKFKSWLNAFVEFNQQLFVESADGKQVHIPVIFRPWHEHNGDWFWWAKGHTEEAAYQALWRFTVEYLRDEHQQHNLIYAFSPDRSRINLENFKTDYLWGYPGDDYVDIIGFDNYHDLKPASTPTEQEQKLRDLIFSLSQVAQIAKEKNKLAALSEGGADGVPNPHFWTEVLLAGLMANDDTRRISYVVVWRNANKNIEQRDHFYGPFPEHASAKNFREFYAEPFVLFNDGLPELYKPI